MACSSSVVPDLVTRDGVALDVIATISGSHWITTLSMHIILLPDLMYVSMTRRISHLEKQSASSCDCDSSKRVSI
jgi:hypothetical protein